MTVTDTAIARMPPIIDVGPVPGACEETLDLPPPAHLPSPAPRVTLLAFAAALRANPSADPMLQDLARDYCAAVDQLRDEYARTDGLTADLASAEVRCDLARRIADTAVKELEVSHRQVAELQIQLRTERDRVKNALASHRGVVEQLAAGAVREFGLRRKIEVAETLRVAALQDAEQLRRCAISATEQARTLHGVVGALEAERHRSLELRPVPVFDLSDVPVPRTITPRQAVKAMAQGIGEIR